MTVVVDDRGGLVPGGWASSTFGVRVSSGVDTEVSVGVGESPGCVQAATNTALKANVTSQFNGFPMVSIVTAFLYRSNIVLFSVKAQLEGSVVVPGRASIHRVSASGIPTMTIPSKAILPVRTTRNP